MKKWTVLLISFALLFSLAGCASAGAGNEPTEQPESAAAEPAQNSDVLVVYFSATNNTEGVAQIIASQMGADLFELFPEQPYTGGDLDWTDPNSRVSNEHNDPAAQNVPLQNAVPERWDAYQTVFVGYPIWWGNAAWPVNGFIDANDFSGKTVVPFCTSSSSGLGESAERLAQRAGEGNWLEGKRFSSYVGENDVIEWLNGLELEEN